MIGRFEYETTTGSATFPGVTTAGGGAGVVVDAAADGVWMEDVLSTSGEDALEGSWSRNATLAAEGEGRPGDKDPAQYSCFQCFLFQN